MSLSIADAKVDTLKLPAKSYSNFFMGNFEQKSQKADLQTLSMERFFNNIWEIDIYMLQNMGKV